MSPFVEGRDENVMSSFPISDDPAEESEHHKAIRNTMIWMDQASALAQQEAKRLRFEYGTAISAEKIMEALSEEEYEHLARVLLPWSHEEKDPTKSLRYHLFAVIMHHGSAYSGHYSAYIRDCLNEGNWTPPYSSRTAASASSSSSKYSKEENEVPKGLCYILPRPGEVLVLESTPLNVVLSIVHSNSFDIPTETTSGRTRGKQSSLVLPHPNDSRPSIEVCTFHFYQAVCLLTCCSWIN
jgi:hypothetical protein